MNEIKHTPELEAYGPFVSERRGDTTHQVADCSMNPHGTEYARLFAAAPKLLDLITKARRYVGMVTDIPGDDPIFAVMDDIDAAIALATQAPEAAPEPVRHFRACGEGL
ncbi:hypothetical protein [Burkholderia sp. HI2500]|uniref:hypothetical protein n=1 Tax=Burkholderia sp. HI2500 TaxID=2015358 RepID=UPI000B7A448D|nr:hypothetical protein [Burkholderia sp. HI2500]OXJ16306.1 hypothetical protein CFB45_06995 [Burkholderia sp. HI2500]